ncbi:MAG: hypothetical protein PUG15_09530, partial [Bacteroidales bacterium]|nr:hypothetical protein [Bacteroidales bacterium]
MIFLLVAFVGILGLLYMGGRYLEAKNRKPEVRGDYQQRYAYEEHIEVDGVMYRRRKDVASILLMGIDRDKDAQITGYRNGGQSDFLQLLV